MKSSLKTLAVAASCLSGLAVVNAEQYTTLEPVGNSSTRQEYVTATPNGALPPSNATGSSNIITSSTTAEFGRRMDDLGAGLIGRRYFYVTYDYAEYEKDGFDSHSNGATVRANFPLATWVDVGAQYSYANVGSNEFYSYYPGTTNLMQALYFDDLSEHRFTGDLTFHLTLEKAFNIKPYARISIGGAIVDGDAYYAEWTSSGALSYLDYQDLHDSTGTYGGEIGIEIPILKQVSITPFAAANFYFDSDYESDYLFGGKLNIYLTHGFGLMGVFASDKDGNIRGSAGVSFSF